MDFFDSVKNNYVAIIGAMWGDEGKGRIVHQFSKHFDWVVRYSGAANAGHTLYRNGKKYVHHLLPSVDWSTSSAKAFLGSGMVIDLDQLLKEIEEAEVDFPGTGEKVYVDPDAFLVLPHHKEEDKAKNQHIGSTNKGVGPAYVEKINRAGTRVSDVMNSDIVLRLRKVGVQFRYVLSLVEDFKRAKVLFEGAQGVLLDINHGTYPYVTCSDTSLSGIYASGFGFLPRPTVLGVTKAYVTRVGAGPFPTELEGEVADKLRALGKEYGATTGRPRRVGWMDLPALKYACLKGSIDMLVITKMDIFQDFDYFNVCEKYNVDVYSMHVLKDMKNINVLNKEIKSWKESSFNDSDFVNYVEYIKDQVGISVHSVSVGVTDQDLMLLKNE